MSDSKLRLRAVLERYYAVFVLAAVVCLLGGGVLVYGAYASPPTETEQATVGEWESSPAFVHGATVEEDNPVFEVGDRLENRSVYFTSATPVLDGRFVLDHRTTNVSNATVTVDLSLVIRGTEDETVVWTDRRELDGTTTAVASEDADRTAVPFSVRVPDLAARIDRIQEDLGPVRGTTEAVIRADVKREGVVGERHKSATSSHELTLTPREGTYRVEGDATDTEPLRTTQRRTVDSAPGIRYRVGGPAIVLLGLVAITSLAWARYRDIVPLEDPERAWLQYRSDRDDYEEWILDVDLPESGLPGPRAQADTLADLVEYGIDTGNAVCRSDGRYYVVTDEVVSVFVPPDDPRTAPGGDRSPTDWDGASTTGAGHSRGAGSARTSDDAPGVTGAENADTAAEADGTGRPDDGGEALDDGEGPTAGGDEQGVPAERGREAGDERRTAGDEPDSGDELDSGDEPDGGDGRTAESEAADDADGTETTETEPADDTDGTETTETEPADDADGTETTETEPADEANANAPGGTDTSSSTTID